ncbi:MAG: glucose-6-phosphate isomerase, partial [Polyangiaceae bacterium]|nr:glucose-6-phosphate isomerase [Polyangiaceae bacterium]
MEAGLVKGQGPSDADLDALEARFADALEGVLAAVDAGKLGFWGLPDDMGAATSAVEFAKSLPTAITDVLVLGIGGSSLGGRALYQALIGPPELCRASTGRRRLHFPDNSDPWLLARLLRELRPESTLALVISKSGGTIETAAQMLIVDAWLGKHAQSQLVAVTDPESGTLRELVRTRGLRSFPIPSNVGGRFSVLTAVGLLPAALAGIDAPGLLEGAKSMADACRRPSLRENPAGLIAMLHVVHHERFGRNIHVLMPYADALRPLAAWYVQLWAESLGKRFDRSGNQVEKGPTPLPAVGATDQHAQVQLFMEGPRDKLVTFIAVENVEDDLAIPSTEGSNSYLGGHRLSALLDAERRGTTLALAQDGRPSLTISLPRLDARSIGALLFLYEAATAIAGELYDIDAFDQPGVEEGKRLA